MATTRSLVVLCSKLSVPFIKQEIYGSFILFMSMINIDKEFLYLMKFLTIKIDLVVENLNMYLVICKLSRLIY